MGTIVHYKVNENERPLLNLIDYLENDNNKLRVINHQLKANKKSEDLFGSMQRSSHFCRRRAENTENQDRDSISRIIKLEECLNSQMGQVCYEGLDTHWRKTEL